MKKPLFTAKEYDQLKEFPVDNLSLVPKLININVSITETTGTCENISSSKLFACLKDSKVLNKDPSTTKPIYYYDFDVKVPENCDFKYQPGDSFGFYPKLSNGEVEFLAERLQVSLNDPIKISGPLETLSLFFPSHQIAEDSGSLVIKTSELLSRLDIKGFPKKAVLRTLAEYCQDEKDAAVLLFLSSRNGSDAYNRLRTEMLSVQMLLAAFDSLKPTLDVLASVVGPLQPRYYSCCRKQKDSDSSFQIVFNVSGNAPESAPEFKVKGVCSGWLESLEKDGELLPIQQRSISHFRLPENLSTTERPIIMIAAGTGVAPFIGFLETLKSQNTQLFTWLIFGFRSLQDDFIFQDDLESFKVEGTLSRLSLAVSRDPIEPKTYVQDIIRKEREEFYKLVHEKDAIIYVCGDELTMIKGVNDAIVELILENNSQMNKKEAESLLMKWTKEKKIIRDIWV